ncbi:unnamed protein product [Ilex paraguariensis]|uniref:Uncharacterized protein n=1 Tax=Ilex paraguariensis TaxID=185542 RepID=A0ABC8QVN2_9AQUA
MSLVNEDQSSLEKAPEAFQESLKEFLLSLSELDVCKNFPSGFDQSIISEFEDISQGIQDRQRIPGNFTALREIEFTNYCRMSIVNEDQSSLEKAPETFQESHKHSRISYTREFLLSLSELDVCKNFPSGFDQSILSEFEGNSQGIQDRQRIPGNFPFQGFRCSDYGSSPPTRGDSGTNSRGIYGRWDSRSSGRSDKDNDSDRDSDSGKQYGNESWRFGQSPEHDGLLGSGSLQRPSGYAAGIAAPKVRANDQYQINKSNEPYHPPRPYKAAPHSRRETNDSFNDETFGSTECTSEDRAEEERRRRSSFELMRKEQQKALQEKQKLKMDKHKNDGVPDIMVLLEDTKAEKSFLGRNDELDAPLMLPVSNNDSGKSSLSSLAPPSRPLVPPGFRSTILERNDGAKPLSHPESTEVGNPDIEQSLLHANTNLVQNGTLDNEEGRKSTHERGFCNQQPEDKSTDAPFLDNGEKIVNSLPGSDVSNMKLGMDTHQFRSSSLLEAHEALDNGENLEINDNKVTGLKTFGDSNHENSSSILSKIFGSALTMNSNCISGLVQHHDSKQADRWSPNTVQSSKFAQWFVEEEKKPIENLSSDMPSDLLLLIVRGEKGGSHVLDVQPAQTVEFPYPSSEVSDKLITPNIPSTKTGISEQLYNSIKQEAVPAVLTCEDLEQTILSEYSEESSTLEPSVQNWGVSGAKTEQPKKNVDDHASHHLLSLIQKGAGPNNMPPSPLLDTGSSDKLRVPEVVSTVTAFDKHGEANAENGHGSGKNLTLETLFGTAFMTELKSGEAPVSVQRGSVGAARSDVLKSHVSSFPVSDDVLLPSKIDEIGYHMTSHESNILGSSHRQQMKLDKVNNWLGFDDPQIELDSSKLQADVAYEHDGPGGAIEIQLPEEESLIAVGDPGNSLNSMFMPAGNLSRGELISSKTPVDIAQKLAARNTVFKDEQSMVGQEGPPFVRGPYDLMGPEIPYQNHHAQPSSIQFHHPQISHGRPLFQPLESHPAHINSQMKFMAPESVIRYDAPPNRQFPENMLRPPFQHPNTGVTGFDHSVHHPVFRQMQMPENTPPPHLLHEFPRGASMPCYPSNQATGFMQEPNLMQRFPFGHRKPNVGGLGVPMPVRDANSGSNHPEAFQRLMEMELRANAKQIHPFPGGHSRGMYGNELDMGFGYR